MAKRKPTAAESLAQARLYVFRSACEALTIAKAVSEEAQTHDSRRPEISEALTLLRKAVTDNGLALLRPMIEQLKRNAPAAVEQEKEETPLAH